MAIAAMAVGVSVFAYFMGNTVSFMAAVNASETAVSRKLMQVWGTRLGWASGQRGTGAPTLVWLCLQPILKTRLLIADAGVSSGSSRTRPPERKDFKIYVTSGTPPGG